MLKNVSTFLSFSLLIFMSLCAWFFVFFSAIVYDGRFVHERDVLTFEMKIMPCDELATL
jgi:hypothetical protein